MQMMPAVLAYFSPETMLPLSSVIATVVGFGLLIQRNTIRFAVGIVRAAFRRRPEAVTRKGPHFAPRSRQDARR